MDPQLKTCYILAPMELSTKQVRYLRSLAHGLSPYHYTPDYLFNWHDQRLFYTVSTTWRSRGR